MQPPPAGPPGPGPSGAWRSAAGRRPPGLRGPRSRLGQGACASVCALGWPAVRRGQCGPRRRAGPAGRGARGPRPAGKLRTPAAGRASPSPRALARGPRACRPLRAHRDLRAPAPPSFIFAKLHRDPRSLGQRTPVARRVGGPGPVGPTARAFVWAPRARRPPWADGDRKGCEARAGAGNPEPSESAPRRRRRRRREEAVTPDGSIWLWLALEGKATSLGTRGEKSVYKTKPWVCLQRESTPGRFVFRKPGKKVEVSQGRICTIFETGHGRGRLGQGIKHWTSYHVGMGLGE